MANDDRGTKREDPDTGKKFYDLNKDPVVSPYTGKSYPRSFFEQTALAKIKVAPVVVKDEDVPEAEDETVDPAAPVIVSLEEADAEESGEDGEDIPEVDGVDDEVEDIGEDEADVFLEEDEDEDDEIGFKKGGGDDEP